MRQSIGLGIIALAASERRARGAGRDAARRLVRAHGDVGGGALRHRHQDGLVQGGRDSRSKLVPLPGSTDCVKAVAHGRRALCAAIDRAAWRSSVRRACKAQDLLHRLSGQHLRHRRAGRQPDQDGRGPQGQAHRRARRWHPAACIVARAIAASLGLDPDTGHQHRRRRRGRADSGAAAVASGRRAVAVYDTQYALIENVGVQAAPHRRRRRSIAYPSNGFIALDDTLAKQPRGGGGAGAGLRQRHHLRHRRIPRPPCAFCGRSSRRPRRPARTRRPRSRTTSRRCKRAPRTGAWRRPA